MSTINRVPVPDLCSLWAETPTTPMHMALIGVLDQAPLREAPSADAAAVLQRVRGAVWGHLDRAPLLRQVLQFTRRGEGRPVWTDDPDFDIARHVMLADLGPGQSDEAFVAWCAQRSVVPLDRTRPLWRMDVVPGLAGGRVGVLVVLHHVVADGLRGVELVSSLLDPAPRTLPDVPAGWHPKPPPSRAELVRDNLRLRLAAPAHVRRPSHLFRSIGSLRGLLHEPGGPAPVTFLSGPIRQGRHVVTERFALEELRASAHAQGCSINELLLAAVTAGLRDVFMERGEYHPGLVLRASVPVGALAGRDGGMMMAPLPVGIENPGTRLRLIVEATRPRKERADQGVAGIVVMPAGLARLCVRWARHAASSHINLYVTNVPGPVHPLYLGGARLLEAVPLAPLVAGVRLSVTALSYDGQFVVTLLADDGIDELPVLAEGLRAVLSRVPTPAMT